METRHKENELLSRRTKAGELPPDYLKMVTEVFSTHFDEGLKALSEIKKNPRFQPAGAVFLQEVVLSVSLIYDDEIAGTTVHASADYDPKASSPTIQDLLSSAVDAIGAVFDSLIDPKDTTKLEQLVSDSLSALEEAPFEWTPIEVNKREIFLKVDKSNPNLEQMADDWLLKNDPDLAAREEEEQKATEELFVTGPKKKPGSDGGLH